MAKKVFNPEDFKIKLEKKLNMGRKPGFYYDVMQEYNGKFHEIKSDVSTAELLKYLDNKDYIEFMQLKKHCICIICDQLFFKFLNTNTLWAYESYYNNYVLYYDFNETDYKYLFERLKTHHIRVCANFPVAFIKTKMLKFCPKWSEFKITSLPKLTSKDIDRILSIYDEFERNKGYYYQINKLSNQYRIPQAVCGVLAKSVISINTHIVLERILQVMSHSTAILDNSDTEQPYRFNFKTFLKDMTFVGRKAKKQDIVVNALNELISIGLIDKFNISNDSLIFRTSFMTKHIRQQIKRNTGYYSDIPGSKQAPFIATFINYLAWIINCPAKYDRLTISLETLLSKHLGLSRLLDEHRLNEIAKVLTLLRKIGLDYGLLKPAQNTQDVNSADVKYLLQYRTELHTFMQLQTSSKDEKEKKNGN